MRYTIYLFGGYNGSPTLQSALDYAKDQVKNHYIETGNCGESFALIYDKLNHYRWFVWLDENLVVRYKKII